MLVSHHKLVHLVTPQFQISKFLGEVLFVLFCVCVWSGGGTVSPTCMFIGVDIWDFDGFFWGVRGVAGYV